MADGQLQFDDPMVAYITFQQLSTIIAALRQVVAGGGLRAELELIATNDDQFLPMSFREIEGLVQKLNTTHSHKLMAPLDWETRTYE